MIELLPPAWVLILAAVLIALTRGPVRTAIVLIAPLIALVEIWFIPDGVVTTVGVSEGETVEAGATLFVVEPAEES